MVQGSRPKMRFSILEFRSFLSTFIGKRGKVTSFSKSQDFDHFRLGSRRGGASFPGSPAQRPPEAPHGGQGRAPLGGVGPKVRPQRVRYRPNTPFWAESEDPAQTPPEGAWRGRFSGRALGSKPFPLGGGWVRVGPPRKRGAALRYSTRWSPHGEPASSHFRP